MKTFENFAILGQFVKVLTAKIFIEYGAVIINGRVIVVSHNLRSFNREKSDFQQFGKFSPAKDSRYTVLHVKHLHLHVNAHFGLYEALPVTIER